MATSNRQECVEVCVQGRNDALVIPTPSENRFVIGVREADFTGVNSIEPVGPERFC